MDKLLIPPEIVQIYEDYLSDTIHLNATCKPTEGLLGFGGGPSADVCHDHFSEHLEQALKDITDKKPSSEEAGAVLRFVYEAPTEYKENNLGYWMMQAVQAHTDKLICFLSPQDAADLAVWYAEAYPKYVRLPAQNRVLAHLQEQAGESLVLKKKSLWKRFGGAK